MGAFLVVPSDAPGIMPNLAEPSDCTACLRLSQSLQTSAVSGAVITAQTGSSWVCTATSQTAPSFGIVLRRRQDTYVYLLPWHPERR